jgi:hypothetical protein
VKIVLVVELLHPISIYISRVRLELSLDYPNLVYEDEVKSRDIIKN